MSFIIKTAGFNNYLEYERILIYAVAEMNKIYAIENEFFETCLNCMEIHYVDMQAQEAYLEIDHISVILEKKWAKCDSIVAWFMALKMIKGYEAEPLFVNLGGGKYHVKMRYKHPNSNWIILDPAAIIKNSCESCELLDD